MKFSKDKVLPLGWTKTWQGTGWGLLGRGAALQVKTLGVTVGSELDVRPWRVLGAERTSCILGGMNRNS